MAKKKKKKKGKAAKSGASKVKARIIAKAAGKTSRTKPNFNR